MRALAVFDIDGVLADVRHRLHFLDSRPKDWDGFFAAAAQDGVLAEGLALLQEQAAEHEVVYLTGRPEKLRRVTLRWLAEAGAPEGRLVMRRGRDFRPARVAKRDELRALAADREIALVVDDDPEVHRMLVAEGHPALLAAWVPRPGELDAAQERDGRT